MAKNGKSTFVDFAEEIETAVTHAAAIVLIGLQAVQQGYTTLTATDPLVLNGVQVAAAEAQARGVPPEQAAIGADHVLKAAQAMATKGWEPREVAEATKAPGTPPLTEAPPPEPVAA